MGSVKKPIKIFARLKPLSGQPAKYDIESIDNKDGTEDEILVVDMKNQNFSDDSYHSHRTEMHRFRYTKVFERDCTQSVVFDQICRPVLDSALMGYNGTVFAYGQTGSGKTYSMTGSRLEYDERGIVPRALSYVFHKFQETEDGTQLQGVYVSYLEIYNENGYDLLNSAFTSGRLEDLGKVMLMEDGNQQIHLKNLSVHPVATEDEALHLFYLGEHNRSIAETPMNEASTRSHCIFTVHLNVRESCGSVVRRSKVHLVDLAGSERLANSNISGQLLNEARHINLALHYLEQVIVALGESNRTHIPYRNSMMTSILRDSLGGNCMTSMIATLSLDPKNIPETLSTCRFSQRVALVTNAATLNEEVDPDMLISQLKAEVKRLKATISGSLISPIADNPKPLNSEELNECWNVVSAYLTDPDDNSILAINPDMRLIQTCFRCLKMACNMSKSKSMMQMIKYTLPDTDLYPKNQKVQDILQTLAHRDAEIQILTKMLRQEKDKNRKNNFKAITNSGEDITPRTSVPFKDPREDDAAAFAHLDKIAETLRNPPYSPPESPKALIDKETLLLEGLTDAKKEALDNFMNSYSGKAMLTDTREDLLKRRSDLETVEKEMSRNQINLRQLKRVMMTSNGPEETELNNGILKEAYDTQKRTLDKQIERLEKSRQQMKDTEENLKTLYGKLMTDFQVWWNQNKENGGSNANPLTEQSLDSKPLKDVATGVFKRSEVETISQVQFKRTVPTLKSLGLERTGSSDTVWVDEFKTSNLPTLPMRTSRMIKMKSSPRSPRTSRKQKIAPVPVTIHEIQTKSKASTRENEIFSGVPRAPPATPVPQPEPDEINIKRFDPRYDQDDDIILKDLPMTGDPNTDKEILSFFRTRQAVFRKINEEKQQASRRSSDKQSLEMPGT